MLPYDMPIVTKLNRSLTGLARTGQLCVCHSGVGEPRHAPISYRSQAAAFYE